MIRWDDDSCDAAAFREVLARAQATGVIPGYTAPVEAPVETGMSKAAFLSHVRALYVAGNMADSDNPERMSWGHHSMVTSVCSGLDTMLREMERVGALTADQRQSFYDNM